MVKGETLPTVVYYSHTAADDNQFRMITEDLWLNEANIHILTNDAKYGDVTGQDAVITAGDIITFQDFNLADLFFKNSTAGSNTVIYVIGIVMPIGRRRDLGIPVE